MVLTGGDTAGTNGHPVTGSVRVLGVSLKSEFDMHEYVQARLEEDAHKGLRPAPGAPGDAEQPEATSSRDQLKDEAQRALGAFLIAAPLAPVLAVIFSVLSLATWFKPPAANTAPAPDFLTPAIANLAIAWTILAILAWLLGLSTARGALPGTYGELVQWLGEIRSWRVNLHTREYPLPSLQARTAYWQLDWLCQRIRSMLAENGSHWFVGTGYVNVWRQVHLAQEVLVRLISDDALPIAARTELMRYTGSAMTDADTAVAQLTGALAVVDSKPLPRAIAELSGVLGELAQRLNDKQSTAPLVAASTVLRRCDEAIAAVDTSNGMYDPSTLAALRSAITAVMSDRDIVVPSDTSDPTKVNNAKASVETAYKQLKPSTLVTVPSDVEVARSVIQVWRAKVDQYRDKARSGLTRTRSDLTRTLTMTAVLAYALFWVVLEARFGFELASTDQSPAFQSAMHMVQMATGALALFLWGALIGLFGQLWSKWNANPDSGEDDFGLGISRVVAEPVLAGVAGMCGIVVLTFGGPLLQDGLSGLSKVTAATDLQNAFLPGTTPASLVFSAFFALSPSLLISRLQQAGAKLQTNLSTSSAGDGGGMSASPGAKG